MEADIYPAHIRQDDSGEDIIQTVSEHCFHTAAYARDALEGFPLRDTAYLAGLLHDLGKYTDAFRDYICKASHGEKVVRGSVNHTFAGVHFILEEFARSKTTDITAGNSLIYSVLTNDVLAYAVGAHHGQYDCVDDNGRNGFTYRATKQDIDYDHARVTFLTNCADQAALRGLYSAAYMEMRQFTDRLVAVSRGNGPRAKLVFQFYAGVTARMVQSAVIEGDRRDTAEFMQGKLFSSDQPEGDKKSADNTAVWQRELAYAENKMRQFDKASAINQARGTISDLCRQKAEDPGHLWQLNVPTGSGKTLSALRFALAHAAKWGKQRLIFTSPLLSILEQNAAVIRSFVDDQSIILEHHSNAVQPEADGEELDINELRLSSWDAPVVITTLVQLLNTFFAGQPQCIRRFHSLCNAVVVIDEVQSVPTNLLTMFNLMINYLTQMCGTTVVLCSATQPAWDSADYPLTGQLQNLVPYDPAVWKPFERTRIIDAGRCRTDLLSQRIREISGDAASVLIICNKKSESELLYQQISAQEEGHCYHLSASMCMAHRRSVLQQMRMAMEDPAGNRVICVSTQVIEAGVDISFACVIRLLGGLDNVAQAAGRCNRNGESSERKPVYILNCTDENLDMLSEIQMDKKASQETLLEFQREPEIYRNDLSSEQAVAAYYHNLYALMPQGHQDDPVKGQHTTVFELLSDNHHMVSGEQHSGNDGTDGQHILRQAFRTAGEAFHVFDSSTIDVIIPYGRGAELIAELGSERCEYDQSYCSKLLQEARNYTVTLYPYQKKILEREGALARIDALDLWYLLDGYYSDQTGVTMEREEMGFLSV